MHQGHGNVLEYYVYFLVNLFDMLTGDLLHCVSERHLKTFESIPLGYQLNFLQVSLKVHLSDPFTLLFIKLLDLVQLIKVKLLALNQVIAAPRPRVLEEFDHLVHGLGEKLDL